MTPQAAAGAGIGGLAVAGAGGSAIAYAAGAFSEITYENFGDYVNKKALTYIGDLKDEKPNSIKKLLEEDKNDTSSNGYRKKLQDK